jgi:anaerobic ribonucleoside-triphosphate reductase activating protein
MSNSLNHSNFLNIAAFHPGTRVLGPGLRAVVWVQGCPFNCKGCIAPDWIPFKKSKLIDPIRIAEIILNLPDLEGITISGGEPMMQADNLTLMLSAVFASKPLTVMVFTGFTLEKLKSDPPNPGVPDFLNFIDVLVDGIYIEKLNDGRGLRGSSNQRFHYLTPRMKGNHFSSQPRNIELYFDQNESFLVGIPTYDFSQAYNKAFQTINKGEI